MIALNCAGRARAALSVALSCALFATSLAAVVRADEPYSYKPAGGFVANAQIAVSIGEIILKSIYGDGTINAERPLTAKLTSDGTWIVRGSWKPQEKGHRVGGVAEIWISKSAGRISRVSHGE